MPLLARSLEHDRVRIRTCWLPYVFPPWSPRQPGPLKCFRNAATRQSSRFSLLDPARDAPSSSISWSFLAVPPSRAPPRVLSSVSPRFGLLAVILPSAYFGGTPPCVAVVADGVLQTRFSSFSYRRSMSLQAALAAAVLSLLSSSSCSSLPGEIARRRFRAASQGAPLFQLLTSLSSFSSSRHTRFPSPKSRALAISAASVPSLLSQVLFCTATVALALDARTANGSARPTAPPIGSEVSSVSL